MQVTAGDCDQVGFHRRGACTAAGRTWEWGQAQWQVQVAVLCCQVPGLDEGRGVSFSQSSRSEESSITHRLHATSRQTTQRFAHNLVARPQVTPPHASSADAFYLLQPLCA